ncbi:MAG: bifunctional folylpolyglutamate synthase/dihydrofolate synthase [Alistipes sp.]|nr:bifunctional folylpolyglutamate synthase/dihydrofolate synthase [Alistipes sp.]
MNYAQTIEYLFTTTPSFQQVGADAYKPGLERILSFCHHLGDPQKNYKTIHVAGTNGKGSVSHMLASVLQHSGYRVGLFTSPHLRDFRERMRVDGEMISERRVVDFVARHKDKMRELDLSFFEMTTAMAFDFFSASDVEVAVIETGLGGRLDATNVILPELCVVTNIGLEHTDLLGDTIEKVAAEKAGIIKPSVPIILGEADEQYNHVFEQRAAACGSRVIYAEQELKVVERRRERDFQHIVLHRERDAHRFEIDMDLVGEYQCHNVVTAAAAADYLDTCTQLTIPRRDFLEGMAEVAATTSLAGRWQRLADVPYTVCDTGHNAHGIKYVADELKRLAPYYNRQICVIGFAKEKSIDDILPLLPRTAYYIFTQASTPRALPAEALASKALAFGLDGELSCTVSEALARAREITTEQDMIFIGGSNFVVAEIV